MENVYIAKASDLVAVADTIREKGGTEELIVFPDGFVTAIQGLRTGIELNFEVVGGTSKPSNPKENTIWVNTSTTIGGYIFSAAQPSGPSAGMIWIVIDTFSSGEFNALKENGIQVYPISAKQYVGGAWVGKTTKIYKNGKWVDWITYLYNAGDECASLTGGWSNRAWRSYDWNTSEDIRAGTLTKNSTNMKWSMPQWSSGVVEVLKDIDLTPFTALHVVLSATLSNTSFNRPPTIAVVGRNASYWVGNAKAYLDYGTTSFSNIEKTLSVEEINEKCDVIIGVHTSSATASITIHRVWLT